MPDAEFFFDTVCPWAWITSRWVDEVTANSEVDVDWRFISLAILNEKRDYDEEFPEGYRPGHQLGLEILRMAAALKDEEPRRVREFYRAFGTKIHERGEGKDLFGDDARAAVLDDAGLPTELVDASHDAAWDAVLRSDTEIALARTGDDVGTPIISFEPPDGPAFFGPVLASVPHGDDAVDLWRTIEKLAHTKGFAELKRSARDSLDFA